MSFNKRFDDLNEQLVKWSNDNIELNNRVTNIEELVNILDQFNSTIHNSSELDIINEILDRESRVNNI